MHNTMTKYTLQELTHLYEVRLKGFDKLEELDDIHTNQYFSFSRNVKIFLEWIKKMEQNGKIQELLATMPKD